MSVEIPGYTVNDKPLYNGPSTLVFHAVKDKEHKPVIIKILKNEHPSSNEIFRFKNECRITQSFNNSWIVRVKDVVAYNDSNALILENIPGPTLSEIILNKGKFDVSSFLKLAIILVNAVNVIHKNHIIHKDINPANLMWDEEEKCIKIIDFGISTKLSTEKTIATTTQQIEGTLAYLSPEQTGRMNRGVDYLSDYYSLGMVFYYLITGKPAFDKKDTLDYIHAHLAIKPQAPHEINPEIPVMLSQLIMRLIEKTPEKRYQSYHGLLFDLEKCQEEWEANHTINAFQLGEKENYNQFKMPRKLYGRKEQIDMLLTKYEHMINGEIQLVFISGYSGIGKTSLINEIQKPIVRSRGYFISGKFEQFKHNIPYAALIQAFNNLFEQILTESEENIASYRSEILNKLGENASVLAEILPHLKDIIGVSKPVMPLGPVESKNRLDYAFQQLILLFSRKNHPLTLFLDDLQWADVASLKIIETLLIHHNIKYLFIICAYRDSEIDASHPLNVLFNDLNEKNISYDNILLSPLTLENVEEFFSDLLHQDNVEVKHFARLCRQKTAGNPFFLTLWLNQLYKDGALYFDNISNNWCWSLEAINSKSMMDNIADLMTRNINRLTTNVQNILKMASCIGNQFSPKILSSLAKISEEKVIELLQETLENELIISTKKENELFYQFAHDRIEKSVYTLLSDEEKSLNHLALARIYQKKLINEDNDLVFEIANQYNNVIAYGFLYLIDADELEKVVEINLSAAQLAKLEGAFDHALKYIHNGLRSAKIISWNSHHKLLYSLYQLGMDLAYLGGNFELMEEYFDIVLPRCENIYEKLQIIEIKTLSLVARTKHHEAIDLVINILPEFGIKIARNPSKFSIMIMFMRIKLKMIGKTIQSLADLPPMKDPEKLAIVKLLTSMMPSTYSVQPNLIPILMGTVILLSFKYGNTKESAIAYTSYGVLLCGVLYNIKDGYEFGNLGVSVLDKLGIDDERTKVNFINYAFVRYWKDHIHLGFSKLIENYHYGIEKGEIEYACYSIMSYSINAMLTGIPVKDYIHTIETYDSAILQLGQKNPHNYISFNHQAAINLVESTPNPEVLAGDAFDEHKMIPIYNEFQDRTSLFFLAVNKLMLLFIFNQYQKEKEIYHNINQCISNIDGVLSSFMIPKFHLYKSLNLSELYETSSFYKKIQIRRSIRKSIKLMKIWSKNNPLACEGQLYLVKALYAEILNKNKDEILELYEKAIALTQRSKMLNEAGIANEKLGRFYLKKMNEKLAKVYLEDARYYYSLWGATAKLKHFDDYYGRTVITNEVDGFNTTKLQTNIPSNTTRLSSNLLDIYAMQKALEMISGTIEINELLEKLLYILTESAGAEYCCLLLQKNNDYFIEAEKYSDSREGSILSSKKIDNNVLPLMIINYVIHKKESLVFDDAANSTSHYAADPYITKNKTKSILCLPLLDKNYLTGVLYLENNLATHAFTKDRIMSLRLLSSQIAIAIDNAHLYADFKKSNSQLIILNKAYERFVPKNFISLLNKDSIVDVELGSQTQKDMTVLFADIREFTSISEGLSSKENFNFINVFLSYMEPVISRFNGFIDKYIGDAIMGLFPTSEDDAVQCAIAMMQALEQYNIDNIKVNKKEVKIGIGLNSGTLLLGTVGNTKRMDATVISDAVNIASRVESQTKVYNKSILITEYVYQKLKNPSKYRIEEVDTVIMKGKTVPITLYSVDASHYEFLD